MSEQFAERMNELHIDWTQILPFKHKILIEQRVILSVDLPGLPTVETFHRDVQASVVLNYASQLLKYSRGEQ